MEKITDCSKSANAVNWTLAGAAGRAEGEKMPREKGRCGKIPGLDLVMKLYLHRSLCSNAVYYGGKTSGNLIVNAF